MATAKEQLYFLEFLLLFSPSKLTLSSEGAVIGEPVPRADVHPSDPTCQVLHFQVGFLRPNCLHGPTYLGQQHVGNFLSNVWEKVDFIVYYEDVLTRRPVKWIFYSGYTAKVMTFEVGAGAVLA